MGILLSVLILFSGLTVSAQITSSSIIGNVSDGNNPIPDAVVTILHEPSGIPYYGITNNRGNYVIANVMAGGPYVVRVERLNYKTMIIKDVEVALGEDAIVDVVLTPSSVHLEEITIFGDGLNSPMNSNRSGAGIQLNSQTIEAIPNVNRSLYDVLRLTPQGIATDAGMSIGGGNYRSSAVCVDGADFNNAFGIGSSLPAGGTPVSLEAIDQLSVMITPFSVVHSGFLGSSINMVTKKGSNKWHGSVYNYFTNSDLRGKRIGNDLLTTPRTLDNTTGLTVSGPIVKNKLFFFFNAEYSVDQDIVSTNKARPNENFEYGGSTGFNRPTYDQMTTISEFLNQRFGYQAGRFDPYTVSTPDYKLFGRIDWHINDYNTFLVRVSHTHTAFPEGVSSSVSPLGGTLLNVVSSDGETYSVNRYSQGRNSMYSLPFEASNYNQIMNFTTVAAELNTRLFNDKGSNTARITWSLQDEPRTSSSTIFPTVDILEPYYDENGDKQLAFFTTFGYDPFTFGNLRRVNTVIITDEFTYKTGIHSILAGAQIQQDRVKNGFMQGGAGWYIYDSWQSFLDDINGVEDAGPAMFMITHANSSTPEKQAYAVFDHSQLSLYAEDDISFSKFFHLTAGLRIEMPVVRFLYDNRNAEFDMIAQTHPNSSYAGKSTADVPHIDFHFSPRIGFNWDITHERKLILRGGTGLFTGRIPNVWLVSAITNSNCIQYQYIANTSTEARVINFHDNYVDIIQDIHSGQPYNRQRNLAAPTNATILARDLRMPTAWRSSIALDYNMPGDVKATFEAIYSLNLNEVYASMLGYTEDGTVQLPGEPEARTHYTSENIYNSENSRMSGYYLHNEKKLHGQYLALTAQLQKNFKFGLDLMAAYTFSYANNISDGAGDQVSSFANTANRNGCNTPEIGYSAFVAPHRVIAAIGYTIKEGEHTATKLGLFYEGHHAGIYNGQYITRYSFLMNNVSGLTAPQLMYIPTTEELASMPFSSEENREAFEEFIASDPYLSKHRGEYSKRNGGKAPWLNLINFRISQEIYFNIAGRRQTLDVGLDLNNLANLLNPKWGALQVLDNDEILQYKDNTYTYTSSKWALYNNISSTWQILFHLRYSF